MLMLYPPIDIASDEMMQEKRALGTYAIGYSLREQYWDFWNDWEALGGLVGLEAIEEGGSTAMNSRRGECIAVFNYLSAPLLPVSASMLAYRTGGQGGRSW